MVDKIRVDLLEICEIELGICDLYWRFVVCVGNSSFVEKWKEVQSCLKC